MDGIKGKKCGKSIYSRQKLWYGCSKQSGRELEAAVRAEWLEDNEKQQFWRPAKWLRFMTGGEMEISVLDKQTIQCVMTEAEIADYGMDKNTIWQNGARAEDFFRQIMKRAQQETGFEKNGGQIAVHAAFLSDESLEITFSVNPKDWMQTAETERTVQEAQAVQTAVEMETAIFKCRNLDHMMEFCKKAPAGLEGSLYVYQNVYFMLVDVRDYGAHEIAVLFNYADEYMDGICYTKSIAAFIREHGRGMVSEHAVSVLRSL